MGIGRLSVLGGVVASALVAGAGCQNKVYDENRALRDQNRELQARLGERDSTPQTPPPLPAPEPVRQPEPPPLRVVAAQPPAAPVTPPPAAPAPAEPNLSGLDTSVDREAGTTTVNFVGDALFDAGKATLKDSAKANLNKVAAVLKGQWSGKPVQVQGHTDSDPIKHSKWKSNEELSQARARAVRDYLVSQGVDAGRVTAEGLGSSKPKDPAATTAAKAKNRRVEIVVVTR